MKPYLENMVGGAVVHILLLNCTGNYLKPRTQITRQATVVIMIGGNSSLGS